MWPFCLRWLAPGCFRPGWPPVGPAAKDGSLASSSWAPPSGSSTVRGQYADVPLAVYFLAAAVCLALADRAAPAEARRWLVLAGGYSAGAAWTKNEGQLFVAALVAAKLLAAGPGNRRQALRDLGWMALGAGPILLALAHFKHAEILPNDLVSGQGLTSTAERLFDLSRHARILGTFAMRTLDMFHW